LNRIKDWLQLLGFEYKHSRFMQYTPLFSNGNLLKSMNFMNKVGNRWLPNTAAVYGISAIKRHFNARPVKKLEKKFVPVGNVGFATAKTAKEIE
ncbi:MAG: hypothetical protein J5680_05220, partial [Neisseriaceae bacterium]|nr:hypothetical protein [Neisseriaceae bacterium]